MPGIGQLLQRLAYQCGLAYLTRPGNHLNKPPWLKQSGLYGFMLRAHYHNHSSSVWHIEQFISLH
jgi:hypothetical protein